MWFIRYNHVFTFKIELYCFFFSLQFGLGGLQESILFIYFSKFQQTPPLLYRPLFQPEAMRLSVILERYSKDSKIKGL